ncbi:MCE family protein [Actinomadura flavalba]|uniref:MCE family protein n=1 Tax=Actinomadura flavalba TaxID=1120938 RepID=UPI0003604D64|nr:MCE family protein [Actinomadura flavalba]
MTAPMPVAGQGAPRRKPAKLRLRRPKPVRDRNPITVAIVGIVAIVVASLVALSADDLPVIGGGTTYTADFRESAGLREGNEVRVAGVKVGKITKVRLNGAKVRVSFRVKDAWVGNTSTAAIAIKTLLGDKFLAVDPLGPESQDPGTVIPVNRTTSPYDVTRAFEDLASNAGQIDSAQLASSLDAISSTFSRTSPSVRKALDGMSALSKTISSKDAELNRLLAGSRKVTGTLADQNESFEALLRDGNVLLAELRRRREAIHGLLVGTEDLGRQLSGFVQDNDRQLRPSLLALEKVTDLLLKNQKNLDRVLKLAGPYTRVVGNTMGNGRWMDGYLCGLVLKKYLPPGTPPEKGCQATVPGTGKRGQ